LIALTVVDLPNGHAMPCRLEKPVASASSHRRSVAWHSNAVAHFGDDFKRAESGCVVVDLRRQHQFVRMGFDD
jgi:hypothetical protein